MVRFIHTADWQLGMTRAFLNVDAQARFSEARIETIRKIGHLAEEESCPFVVVCGDVFETNHVERQVIVRALDAMAGTPDVTFYLLPGNHDPLNASSVFRSKTFLGRCPSNVVVLDKSGVVDLSIGVQIVAAPWTSKRPLEDLVARAIPAEPSEESVRIVVGHGAVDTLSPDPDNPALIHLGGLDAAIAGQRVQFAALGDRHSTMPVGDSGRVWYSGAPEPTAHREIDPGNVLIVDVDTSEVSVTPHAIGVWKFLTLEFDLRNEGDLDELESTLDNLDDKSTSIVQLILVGQISLGEKIRLDTLLDHFSDLFASLNTWERHTDLVVLPDDEDFTSLGLSGFAQDALDDLIALAGDSNEQAEVAQDALALLYRFAGDSA